MSHRPILASLLALGVSMGIVAGASAQTFPQTARLITGTCSQPGEHLTDLTDVSAEATVSDGAPAGIEHVVQALGEPVEVSLTIIPLPLADIVAHERAIVVETGAGGSTVFACGEIGGFAPQGTDLQIGLSGAGDSAARGVAWLHANGDDTTAVTILVTTTPGAGTVTAAGSHEDVVIQGSQYVPNPLVVARGTTVTWTDEDSTPHTVTATDRAFDSGYLGQEDSFSLTFDSPGTFDYFCVYHPRMRGTVIVE